MENLQAFLDQAKAEGMDESMLHWLEVSEINGTLQGPQLPIDHSVDTYLAGMKGLGFTQVGAFETHYHEDPETLFFHAHRDKGLIVPAITYEDRISRGWLLFQWKPKVKGQDWCPSRMYVPGGWKGPDEDMFFEGEVLFDESEDLSVLSGISWTIVQLDNPKLGSFSTPIVPTYSMKKCLATSTDFNGMEIGWGWEFEKISEATSKLVVERAQAIHTQYPWFVEMIGVTNLLQSKPKTSPSPS